MIISRKRFLALALAALVLAPVAGAGNDPAPKGAQAGARDCRDAGTDVTSGKRARSGREGTEVTSRRLPLCRGRTNGRDGTDATGAGRGRPHKRTGGGDGVGV